MKIMICISQLKKGGAERVVTNLANYFIGNNDVTIVSLKAFQPEYNFDKKINIVKIDSSERQNKILKLIKRIFKLNKIIKREKPDIVLSFLPEPSFLILLIKKIQKIKVIVSVRNDPKVEYKNVFYNIAMRLLYPKADGFVFQTEDAKSFFSNKIQKKSTIIMNPLNPEFLIDRFEGIRKKEIVAVGRLFEQKNHELLIKAFSIFHKKHPDYTLTIYGEGPLKEHLKKITESLKIKNYVSLPGVENDIKNKIYQSSVFVLSSNYEGMPNSLMEALTLGLPCISTDCPCGGPRALIKDGVNGILTEVGNVEMLAEKLSMIIENKKLLNDLSKNTREYIKDINPNKINKEWEEYIKQVLNKG